MPRTKNAPRRSQLQKRKPVPKKHARMSCPAVDCTTWTYGTSTASASTSTSTTTTSTSTTASVVTPIKKYNIVNKEKEDNAYNSLAACMGGMTLRVGTMIAIAKSIEKINSIYIDGNRQRMLDENGNFEITVIEIAWMLQFGFYLKDMDYRYLGNQDGKIDEQKLQAAMTFLCQRNGFIYTYEDSKGYGHHIAFIRYNNCYYNMDSMNKNAAVISKNEIGSILKQFWNAKNSSRYHSGTQQQTFHKLLSIMQVLIQLFFRLIERLAQRHDG